MGRAPNPNSPGAIKRADLERRRALGQLDARGRKAGSTSSTKQQPKGISQLDESQIRTVEMTSVIAGLTPNGWVETPENLELHYKDLAKQSGAPEWTKWKD